MEKNKSIFKILFLIFFIALSSMKLFTTTITHTDADISHFGATLTPQLTTNAVIVQDVENYISENSITILATEGLGYFNTIELLYTLWWITLIVLVVYILNNKYKKLIS